jgi:hypothetical protein
MVELDSPGQTALSKQTQLGGHELVELASLSVKCINVEKSMLPL